MSKPSPAQIAHMMSTYGVDRLRRINRAGAGIESIAHVLRTDAAVDGCDERPALSEYTRGGLRDALDALGYMVAEDTGELLASLGAELYDRGSNRE